MSFTRNLASYLNLDKKPREPRIFSSVHKIIVGLALLAFFLGYIVYPSLSIITYAVRNNVSLVSAAYATRSKEMYDRNIDCFSVEPISVKVDKYGIANVALNVCPSSDIMVMVTRKDGNKYIKWVDMSN